MTPGSIVSVAPAETVTLPSRMYGLPAALHVVFVEIVDVGTWVDMIESEIRCAADAIPGAASTTPATSRETAEIVRRRHAKAECKGTSVP